MKKHFIQLLIIALLITAALVPTATAGAVNATRIYLRDAGGNDVTGQIYGLNVDDTVTLAVDLYNASGTVDEEFTCKSTYPAIAACEADTTGGTLTVTAVKAGTSTVTVTGTNSRKTAKISVTVGNMASAVTITAPTASYELSAGTYTTLAWTIDYTDGTSVENKNATFTTSDKNVTVKSNGRVTANTAFTKETDVTITACSSDNARDTSTGARICDSVTITVIPAPKSVDICTDSGGTDCPAQIALDAGDSSASASLYAIVTPDTADQTVTWTSGNTRIALVDEVSGEVTLPVNGKTGTATITARTVNGKSTTIKVFVGNLVKTIVLEGESTVTAGKTTKITATITDPDSPTNKNINWKVCDADTTTPSECTASAYATVSAGTVRAKQVDTDTTVYVLACPADGNNTACVTHALTITPAVSSIKLFKDGVEVTSKDIYAIEVDDATGITFTAQILPADADQNITWSVSSTAYADVDEGTVTGKKKGTVTVTAKAADGSGKSASARVRIVGALVTAVDVTRVSGVEEDATGHVNLANGQTVTLKAAVSPTEADNKNVTWSVVDPGNCTSTGDYTTCAKSAYAVVSGGKVTARQVAAPKDLLVLAQAADGSGAYDTYEITIIPVASKVSIYYTPRETGSAETDVTNKTITRIIDLNSGDSKTIELSGKVAPETAEQKLTWKSSSTAIAGVDDNGKVTFYNSGTVTITATTTDGTKRSAKVTITGKIVVDEIVISGSTSVAAGKSIQLKAQVIPDNATTKTLKWTTSNSGIATVNSSGKVTGSSSIRVATPVTIYATATDVDERHQTPAKGEYVITVYPAVTSLTILGEDSESKNGKTIGMDLGAKPTYQLTSYTEPSGASSEVTWKSSSTKIATVDENGLVTAVANGSCTITCTAADGSGKSAKVTIKVSTLIQDIEITGAVTRVRTGKSITLTATLNPNKPSNSGLTWVSEDTSIATVSGSGLTGTVTGKKAVSDGDVCTNIYAVAKDGSGVASDKLEICVYPAAASVKVLNDSNSDITGSTIELPEGETLTISGRAYPDGAAQEFTFTTANKNIVEITDATDNTAVLTSLKKGSTITITVKTDDGTGKTATIKIKTVAAQATGLTLTALSASSLAEPMMLMAAVDEPAVVSEDAGTAVALTAGDTLQLGYEITPVQAAENEVAWFSSDESLATVSEDGVVTVAENLASDANVTITGLVMDGSATSGSLVLSLSANPLELVDVDAEAVVDESVVDDTAAEETATETVTEEVTVTETGEETSTETVTGEETATETVTETGEDTLTETPTETAEAAATDEAAPTETVTETVTETSEDAATETAETPTVSEIKLDVANDTVSMYAGENVTITSDKLTILPENADVSAIEFKVENEAVAKLRYDKFEDIMANGLIIDSVAAGETKLTIKCGDVEKTLTVIVYALPTATPTPELPTATPEPTIDVAATEQAAAEAEAAAKAAAEAEAAAQAAAEAEAAAQAAAEAEAAAQAAAEAEAAAQAAAEAETTVVENTGDSGLS